MKRGAAVYVLPVMVVLVWSVIPLIRGSETLFQRDVFNTHLEKKWIQAEAMKEGRLPLIDSYRDGGQPHLGNPNSVSLYPDNLLFLVAPTLWAFNAHFWLHLLIAPFTFYWLARVWGLRSEAAWAAGVFYGTSGFFLSTMNLYNLVGGVTWTPAFVAAVLQLATTHSRGKKPGWAVAGTAICWVLLILAGDPMTAVAALGLAGSALILKFGWRRIPWMPVTLSIVLGTMIAAPQWVEFLRVLSLTFRGYMGYSPTAATAASWNPITLGESLIPFLFGRPDLTFWGQRFYGGDLPLFMTLYPGLLALVLAISSGKPNSAAARWSMLVIGIGVFFALGGYNPLVRWLLTIPGLDLLRLPIKFWVLVAVGFALLCGLGFERIVEGKGEGWVSKVWLFLLLTFILIWVVVNQAPQLIPASMLPDPDSSRQLWQLERLRWAGHCLLAVAILVVYFLIWRLTRRKSRLLTAALLTVHTASQLFLLQPALATDEVAAYLTPPALLADVPLDAVVAHGNSNRLFGPTDLPLDQYPDASLKWLQRQVFEELYPVAGILYGRRYDFSLSAEGLDSFLTRATAQSLSVLSDLGRVRLLAASGVDLLILGRELDSEVNQEVRLAARRPSLAGEIFVYELSRSVEEAYFVGRVLRAPHLNAALSWLTSDEFEPSTMAVLPEGGEAFDGAPGEVTIMESLPESISVEVSAPEPGVLVIQRAFLPIYKARVNGEPGTIEVANMHRMGIELPQGEHKVVVWVDRSPLVASILVSIVGLILICVLVWRYGDS